MAGSFLCLAALGLQAQNTSSGMTIADNQVIKISGTIELKHLGYTTHVLLEVAQPMRADFADGEQKTVHEIEIFSPSLSSAIKSHLHEKAVVEGRIMLEDASPYYFNGVALHADRITIGQKVLSTQEENHSLAVPATLQSYYAEVIYQTKLGEFTYQAWDQALNPIENAKKYLGCSLNGSGELINCFCSLEGFDVAQTGYIKGGRFIATGKPSSFDPDNPKRPPLFAQFELPEKPVATPRYAVNCSRKKE